MHDIKEALVALEGIPDETLRRELRALDLGLDPKFHLAFSSYGLTKFLSAVPSDVLLKTTQGIPGPALEGIRWSGALLFRAYTAFLYMRSDTLERRLDTLPTSSPLRPFRDFFRAGSHKKDEATPAQHIRNALAHGTFVISEDMSKVRFTDRSWSEELTSSDVFDRLCHQVFRFYLAAFEATESPTFPTGAAVST